MKPPTQWTEPMLAELKLRRERGETIPAIGIVMGLAEEIVRNKSHKMKFRSPKYIPLDRETLRTHYDNGLGIRQIGELMGVSYDKVSDTIVRYGFPPRPPPKSDRPDMWTEAEKAVLVQFGYTKTSIELVPFLPGRSSTGIRLLRSQLRALGVALPVKGKQPRPAKNPPPSWTEAEESVVIHHGYTLTSEQLAELLPARTWQGCERARRRLTVEGKIARPMRQPAKEKPAREAKPPRVRKAKVAAPKPVKATPARRVVEVKPVSTTELQPGQERTRHLPWHEIQHIGLQYGIELRTMTDHQKLINHLSKIGQPLVFLRRGAAQ